MLTLKCKDLSREEFIEAMCNDWVDEHRLSPNTRKINKYRINHIYIPNNEEGVDIFNMYYQKLVLDCPYDLGWIEFNKKRSIKQNGLIQLRYHFRVTKSGCDFIYLGKEGAVCIIFGSKSEGDVSGGWSYRQFLRVCKKYKVDLTKFAIKNGEKVKETIENPKIDFFGEPGHIYLNAHHLDLNSSYMCGIAAQNPDLWCVIKDIYKRRQKYKEKTAAHIALNPQETVENDMVKAILTHTYGYFQSEYCTVKIDGEEYGYAYAELSRQAHCFNNRYIEMMTEQLKANGNFILAYNTDGIWYTGEIYHDENESSEMLGWTNDHINCKIRFKSKGAYEYIEGEKYTPVVRGMTDYDKSKPRKEWVWGDVIRTEAAPHMYEFNEDFGIKVVKGE